MPKTTVDSKGLTFNGDSGSTNVEKLGSTVTVAGDRQHHRLKPKADYRHCPS